METAAIKEGAYVTTGYIIIFYVCITWQSVASKRLLFAYKDRGERFERYYNTVDKPMLGWDRVVGNLLEQAMPFLTLFWINVGLAAIGATPHQRVIAAGWIYVVFRALYPVAWFAGGGSRGGARSLILCSTFAMYAVIIFLLVNMLVAVKSF